MFTKDIKVEGHGPVPVRGQTVTVNCTGIVQASGKKFWSTDDTGPFSFKIGLGQVISAWDQGVITMKLGEKATITASSDSAYGDDGFPAWGIPPKATLIFEVELTKIA